MINQKQIDQQNNFRCFIYNYDNLSSKELQCLADELEMYRMNVNVTWQDTLESLFGDIKDMEEEEIPREENVDRYILEIDEAIQLAVEHEIQYQREIDERRDLEFEYWASV